MPPEVIAAQRRKIVSVQFSSVDDEEKDAMMQSIDATQQGIENDAEAATIVPTDRNADVRAGLLRLVNGG